jgi:hypothetical protein
LYNKDNKDKDKNKDKGIFGAEYSLIYMIEEFRKKIMPCLDPTAADHP